MSVEKALEGLNASQHKAVCTEDRHTLVLAGAGTGKTRTIIARAAFLIANGVDPSRIQILTFTRKAAAEIVGRVKGILGDTARGLRASTFHSWCSSLHKAYPDVFGFEGYSVIDRDDQLQVFKLERGTHDKNDLPKASELLDLYSFSRNTDQKLSDAIQRKSPEYSKLRTKIAKVMKGYEAKKQQRKYLDYDDILDIVAQVLSRAEEAAQWVGQQYHCLMVDEMQDTNPLQWKILSPLRHHTTLFCVGDDAQSIYGFRGADFENIHSFASRVENSVVLKLEENYRSTQEILDVANWLLNESPLQYNKNLISHRGRGIQPQLLSFVSEFEEANWIAEQIVDRHENGAPWKNHMALVRSQFSGRTLEAAFLRHGIPYVFFGGMKLLSSAHIKDLLSAIRIVGNPPDEIAWMRFLCIWPGIGDGKAGKIYSCLEDCEDWDSRFQALRENSLIPKEAMKTIQLVYAARENVRKALEIAFERMKKELERAYGKLNWEKRENDFPLLFDLADGHGSLMEFIEEYILSPIFATERRGTDEDCVILSTVHSAKGLESDTVFVYEVSAGGYPMNRSIGDLNLVEEERRVLYVALTRAINELIVTRITATWMPFTGRGRGKKTDDTATYFLESVPAQLFDQKLQVDRDKPSGKRPPKINTAISLGLDLD